MNQQKKYSKINSKKIKKIKKNKNDENNNTNEDILNDNDNDIYNDPMRYQSSKSLQITNLKLQHQIDKFRTKNKELETEVKLNKELRKELNSQIETKDKLLNEFKLQINNYEKKVKDLQEKVLNRDDIIDTLNQKNEQLENQIKSFNNNNNKNNDINILNNSSNSSSPNKINIKALHERTETPGGYKIYDFATPTTPSMAKNLMTPTQESKFDETNDDTSNEDLEKLKKQNIKSLNRKLLQRHNWTDLHARGILKNDPTVSESLAQAQRILRARKSSLKIENFLKQRPNIKDLEKRNIYKKSIDEYDSDDDATLLEDLRRATGMNLEDYLRQRADWTELKARGILHYDPTVEYKEIKKQKKKHKRKISLNVEKFLKKRPNERILKKRNIVKDKLDVEKHHEHRKSISKTLDNFFISQLGLGNKDDNESNGSSMDRYNDIRTIEDEFKEFMTDDLKEEQKQRKKKLKIKIKQRPSIDETMARGILHHRIDNNVSYSLHEQQKQLHKRKASMKIESFLNKRPNKDKLIKKRVFVDKQKKNQHRRKVSMELENKFQKRPSISELQNQNLIPSLSALFQQKKSTLHFDEAESHDFGDDFDDDEFDFQNYNNNKQGLAELFKHAPTESNPPLHNIFENDELKYEIDQKRRGSLEMSGTMYDVAKAKLFKPELLSKKSIKIRIKWKLKQRSSVNEMIMRGILFDHPTVSNILLKRSKIIKKYRASNKTSSLLRARPSRKYLLAKGILNDIETIEKKKSHKRKKSQHLEDFLSKNRPSAVDPNSKQANNIIQSGIPIINVGGKLIPLINPLAIQANLVNNNIGNVNTNQFNNDIAQNTNDMYNTRNEKELTELREAIDDLKLELNEKNEIISELRNRELSQTEKLKNENRGLRASIAKVSTVDEYTFRLEKEKEKYYRQSSEMKEYISKLSAFYGELPNLDQLDKELKYRLNNKLKDRPTKNTLESRGLIVNKKERKNHFRKTSEIVNDLLFSRTNRENLVEKGYLKDINEGSELNTNELKAFDDMSDNEKILTKEIERLKALLKSLYRSNDVLEKEAKQFRLRIEEMENNSDKKLNDFLGSAAQHEEKTFNQMTTEIENSQKIDNLSRENEELKKKIRRLSVIDQKNKEYKSLSIYEFYQWFKQLKWENDINNIFNNFERNENYEIINVENMSTDDKINISKKQLSILQNVIIQSRKNYQIKQETLKNQNDTLSNEYNILKNELDKQKQFKLSYIKDKQKLVENCMNEINKLRNQVKYLGRQQATLKQNNSKSGYFWG